MRDDVEPLIAGYAAVVSTIALIWNITRAICEARPKLRVQAGVVAAMVGIPGVGISDPTWLLDTKVTNLSNRVVYINRPQLEFPEKIGHSNRFQAVDISDTTQYPVAIAAGAVFNWKVPLKDLLPLVNKCRDERKCLRVRVQETSGRAFYSNGLKLAQLKQVGDV